MPKLYIVRHGNTFDRGETVLRVGGRTDLPLSQSGQIQAEALGRWFKRLGITFAACASAPLLRTMQTADAIVGTQSEPPPVLPLSDLREIDYGPDEGQPEAEVVARLGQTVLDAWDQHATPPPDWHVDPSALRIAWQNILGSYAAERGSVLIVTSNGVARFLLDVVRESGGARRKLRTGAYGEVDVTGAGAGRLLSWDIRPGDAAQT